MFDKRILRLALLLLLALPACQISPGYAIADLAAIHNEADWSPRSPAQLSFSPSSYELGVPIEGFRIGEAEWYEVNDHRGLELEILDSLSTIPATRLDFSLEATGWLIIELLHDDYREARIRSAAILSGFAGFWIEQSGVRLHAPDPDADLAAAVHQYIEAVEAIDDPDQVERVRAALEAIDRSPVDDPLVGARLVAGLGRRLRSGPLQATGEDVFRRTALRAILLALETGARDGDAEVADACRVRHELLQRYAVGS